MSLFKCILCFKEIEKNYERFLVQGKKMTIFTAVISHTHPPTIFAISKTTFWWTSIKCIHDNSRVHFVSVFTAMFDRLWIRYNRSVFMTKLACVAEDRKGKGEGKIGAREERREGKRLQPAHCLFRLAPSLICKRLTSTTVCLSNVSQ